MTKILLIDVDSKIPNLALMKISSFFKKEGWMVDLKKLNYSYYPHNKKVTIDAKDYDFVFISIIFRNNRDRVKVLNSQVIHGGVGYDMNNKLLGVMENCNPDYSLYPENDTSYGFITRGCVRDCYFCVVPKKEGFIHQVNEIDDIVKHKKVKFLDNNILAFKGHKKILRELVNKQIRCNFNQGLDIRFLDDENAKLLSELNYLGDYTFAFDQLKDLQIIESKLKIFKKYVPLHWKSRFFLYVHPEMCLKSVVFRIQWCFRNEVKPYFMRDESCWKSPNRNFYTYLASWCNQPHLFKNMTFEEFMMKRTQTKSRQDESISLWKKYSNLNAKE